MRNKLRKLLLAIILMVFCATPILAGCDLNIFGGKTKLDSPNITLYDEDNCITFKAVDDTTTYDIYCNDEVVDTYENEEDNPSILYDFSYLLEDSGIYEFYVVAISNSLYLEDSDPSNVVEKNYTKIETPTNTPVEDDVVDEITFNLSTEGVLSYTPINDVNYYVYLYSNNTGLNSYPITTSVVNLNSSTYIPTDGQYDIYAVKLGYVDADGSYVSSDIKYYNRVNCAGYSDKIYIFNGTINDHYITSLTELKHIVYYSFIYRIEDFDIKLSDSFKTQIENTYSGSSMASKMNYAIHDAIKSYFETMAYYANNVNSGYVAQINNSTEYNVKISYYGVKECDTTIEPSSHAVYEQGINSAYYDTVEYEMLGSEYDEFVSDDYYLSTECATSEQLYWAVESNITPKVVAGSRAEIIYNKAKNVLREIISEEMTDYEKALSIFDWICINTNYDYTDYSSYYRGGVSISNIPMYLPCYYLEGVFITGYSVCDGFSKAYSLMCNMLGIDAIRIVGTAISNGQSGGHAWNKVLVDTDLTDNNPAKYYFVDITWTEILSSSTEELSHLYFMLGDDDVADTHKDFSSRNEFKNYKADENYYYYQNDTFTYYDRVKDSDIEYNWVIENNTELKDLFYYTLDNQLSSVEFVVDIDMMVDYYEYVNGENSYCSSNDIDYTYYEGNIVKTKYVHSEDTLYAYSYINGVTYVQTYPYYELRSTFIECMRSLKFNEQYFMITNYDGAVKYGSGSSDVGVLYILQHNLLIDSITETSSTKDEPKHLVEYFNNAGISGTYTLYVENTILSDLDGSYLERLQTLLSSYLTDAKFALDLKHIDATQTEQVFELKIFYIG